MKYLSVKQVVAINTYQIQIGSPNEITGVKEHSALEMAINMPKATAFGVEMYPTIESKAGVLLINLVQKHCFHNANKRTAAQTMLIFLKLNNYEFNVSDDDLVEFVVSIATWRKGFDELKINVEDFIRKHMAKI
ncbi:type II toxin-antitoxin system death-on-curing family toxin [Candidatus Enterococcus mansonii]|uniref:Fido domain-containing protein n=1 Tax=Candidatus Enterococcus mansonii TaxID=1834181 RepID=A0A242C606_9ENTE|nr:type II toxin-antitoxin system death-on-curing family toxin [Enterococcus sp. 4G2_DIV0659]OTO05685.1 hypothetical protein A5880_002860 [Enterococcus sp. 4G2_DIV0659]